MDELQFIWSSDSRLRDKTPRNYPFYWGEYFLVHPVYEGKRSITDLAISGSGKLSKEGQLCIIKRVRKNHSSASGFEDNFANVGKDLFLLNHRNITKIYDIGENDHTFYHCREFVFGKDLMQLLLHAQRLGRPFPLDLSIFITVEILRGLYSAWKQLGIDGRPLRMNHGEINPTKILISYNGEIKILGFGWNWIKPSEKVTWPVGSTYPGIWVTPEELVNSENSVSGDVFNVAMILYSMITLKIPGSGSEDSYIQRLKSDSGQPVSLEGIPNIIKELLEKSLELNPEKRIKNCGELLRPLRALLYKVNPRIGHHHISLYLEKFFIDEKEEESKKINLFLPKGSSNSLISHNLPKIRSKTLLDTVELKGIVEQQRINMANADENIYKGIIPGTKYRIVRLLGEGSMGSVYEVEHIDLEKIFAMKLLHSYRKSNRDFVERFKQEARAVAKLAHPNIVSISDYGETEDNIPYFVMEYLEGEPLSEYIDRNQDIDFADIINILLEVCQALSLAHNNGIVHRDIKPENIFLSINLDGKRQIKLLDFGIASIATNPSANFIAGTPLYMSPEQARGEKVDYTSDLYSLGILAYRMFTGVFPFIGNNSVEILHKHCSDQPLSFLVANSDKNIPIPLEEIVMKAISKSPKDRFQTADEMSETLKNAAKIAGINLDVKIDKDSMIEFGFLTSRDVVEEIDEIWSNAFSSLGESIITQKKKKWVFAVGLLVLIPIIILSALMFWHNIDENSRIPININKIKKTNSNKSIEKIEIIKENIKTVQINSQDAGAVDIMLFSENEIETNKTDSHKTQKHNINVSQINSLIVEAKIEIKRWRLSKAEEFLEQAKKIYPDYPDLLESYSELRFEQGRYDEAYNFAQKAVKRRPGNVSYLINLGVTLYRMGKAKEARDQWEKVLKINPDNNIAKYYLKTSTNR